jgi:hypothetical protein
MKPGGESAPLADRFRKTCKTEKDSLKDILRIVTVPDQPPSGSQHHGTVARHQQLERFAILGRNEAIEKHGVFVQSGLLAQSAKIALQHVNRSNGHASILVGNIQP